MRTAMMAGESENRRASSGGASSFAVERPASWSLRRIFYGCALSIGVVESFVVRMQRAARAHAH